MDLQRRESGVRIVAEIGVNHNGSLDSALQMVDEAADAGVDAVKVQAFQAERLVMAGTAKAQYQKDTTGSDEDQLDMLRRYQLSSSSLEHIASKAISRGLMFIGTPFDRASADTLCQLPLSAIKVGSGDVNNHPFLRYLAQKGKPIILSTGMATLGEIEQAVELMSQEGLRNVTLLHCTSSYPTVDSEANLRVMDTLRAAFQLPVGYSDHTIGTDIAVAAAALGAVMVEKHFTLDKHLPGPDHAMSLDTAELRSMVAAIRRVEKALGSPVKRVAPGEQDVRVAARRSICAARRIRAGERIVEGVLDFRRPGNGIPPSMVHFVLGRVARKDIESGEMVTWDAL